jgi:DNA modification methylase
VKVPPKKRPDVAERVDKVGARQAAADYGISERQARSIATREKKAEEKKKARQERATDDAIEGIEIHHGDFRELGDCVADGSVDLIFTDPPYDRDSVPLYADLAAYAARKLKPGGWCLAYSGHAHLPEVFVACAGALTYGWTFAVRHKDANLRFRNVKIHNGWKPILGFYRPPLDAWWDWMTDIVSGGKEKDEHEWQQAEAEATHFIDAMAPDGGLIVDPFIGGGTTALAAHRTGRRCVGFEIKAETVRAARKRLSDHKKTKRG